MGRIEELVLPGPGVKDRVDAPVRAVIVGGGLAGVAALSLTVGYRMKRFTAWLNPEADLDGAGWHKHHR